MSTILTYFYTPENIFKRLVFSDENDVIYKDDDYKNAHKDHYLADIQEDLSQVLICV